MFLIAPSVFKHIQTYKTKERYDPIKCINILGPQVRYEFDISYFNKDLSSAFWVNMIVSIIDAFSRKAMIYGLDNKKSSNFIPKILEFCMSGI